jgi:hypothetical protein
MSTLHCDIYDNADCKDSRVYNFRKRLHYTSTLTDNNNVYEENVGKKVTKKKSWMKSYRKRSHKKKVTGKKVTYILKIKALK